MRRYQQGHNIVGYGSASPKGGLRWGKEVAVIHPLAAEQEG